MLVTVEQEKRVRGREVLVAQALCARNTDAAVTDVPAAAFPTQRAQAAVAERESGRETLQHRSPIPPNATGCKAML